VSEIDTQIPTRVDVTRILIKGGRVIDPACGMDQLGDVLLESGRVAEVAAEISPESGGDLQVLDATGHVVTPGLIDMHVHLREPGNEEVETIQSGSLAAVSGGATSVACFPNTDPVIDSEGEAEFVVLQGKRANFANVFPVGAISRALQGDRLSEMAGLARAGAVAFSDADRSVSSAEMLRRAMLYARMLNRVVICHCEDRDLRGQGLVNQGTVSMRLGLPGIPNAAEDIVIARDITLARITDASLHISQMSTEGAVELLRRAKDRQLKVTGEVTPHHFSLTDEKLLNFDANFKMIPPLRTDRDVSALVEGLRDDTIDVITSGHAPHSTEDKEREFPAAPFGVIGMETLFPVTFSELVVKHGLDLSQVVSKLTVNPARILGLYPDRGTLRPGSVADVSVFDVESERQIDANSFRSRSRNCPFVGQSVRGTTVHVVVGGRLALENRELRDDPDRTDAEKGGY
jgi:dihydroorotase